MVKNKDSISYVFVMAFSVCLVCAIVVATAAVSLRPMQVKNKEDNFRGSILATANMLEPGQSIDSLFANIETRLVDMETGTFTQAQDVASFDPFKHLSDPEYSTTLTPQEDLAGIKRLEKYSKVYLVNDDQGQLDKVILPIRGYGLWSTLWGFIALESDLTTIVGLSFYDHAETPGLGGEVDNPKWKSQWPEKRVYDQENNIAIEVTKGGVADPDSPHQIDGLSGATLTTNGVNNLIHFWLGEMGFKPFLVNLKAGDA